MATLYTHQSSNIRKTVLLMSFFLVMVVLIGYLASYLTGNASLVYIAFVFALIMNVGSYWFSDKLVLSMTGAQPVTREQLPELWNVVENLSITAGLPMPRVYVVNDPAPNAFATGRNPEHAVVAVTTGLLQILDRTELEGVIAHELSHVGNRDILVMTVAVVLAGFVAILADFLMRSMMWGGNGRDRHPAFFIIGVVGIILAPIAAQLIQLSISRKREYLADASGALLTRYPEGLASALEKIQAYARPMSKASPATAHLFISDPYASEKATLGSRVMHMFHTHPPAADRIRILRTMGNSD